MDVRGIFVIIGMRKSEIFLEGGEGEGGVVSRGEVGGEGRGEVGEARWGERRWEGGLVVFRYTFFIRKGCEGAWVDVL